MKKLWRKYLMIFGLAGLAGGLLLVTSQNVERKESELRNLRSIMAAEEESLRVLRAEWAYLNRPDHLEALAGQYLDLVSPQVGQMISGPATMTPMLPESQAVSQPVSVYAKPVTTTVIPPRKPQALSKPQRKFQNVLEDLTKSGGSRVQ